MTIASLDLVDFRSHRRQSIEFDPRLTLLVGPNGAGKTNILEAVYLLATGESWRTEDVGEMVNFEAEVGHVTGKIEIEKRDREESRVSVTRGFVGGKRVAKMKYLLDGVSKRKSDFVGQLRAVLFEPESLEIVIGDPGHRRAFLNEVLSQTDREYAESLSVYQRALRSRNRLLDAIRDGRSRIEALEYWERALVKHGTIIQDRRRQLVDWMTDQLAPTSRRGPSFFVEYEANVVSEGRLERYRQQEIAAGHTFVGPQRDELLIVSRALGGRSLLARQSPSTSHHLVGRGAPDAAVGGVGSHRKFATGERFERYSALMESGSGISAAARNKAASSLKLLSSYGSRGEQRMAVLQLKLLEAKWIEQLTGDSPVMLLDDIFSELDAEHEKLVGELVRGRQAIMTATEIHPSHYPKAKAINL